MATFPLDPLKRRQTVDIDEEDDPYREAGSPSYHADSPSFLHEDPSGVNECSWKTNSFSTTWKQEDPMPEPQMAYTLPFGDVNAEIAAHHNAAAQLRAQAHAQEQELYARDLDAQAAALRARAQVAREMAQMSGSGYQYMGAQGMPYPDAHGMAPPGVLHGHASKGGGKGNSTSSGSKSASKGSSAQKNTAMDPSDGPTDDSAKTTLMWKNLPNNYRRGNLLELMNEQGFAGTYNFFYAPVDFTSDALLGYAFVNFVSTAEANRFKEHFQGFTEWTLQSEKVSDLAWSDPLQGLEGHIERYRNSPVMHQDISDDKKPMVLVDGQCIPFPAPTKKIRAPHVRGCLQKVRAQPKR